MTADAVALSQAPLAQALDENLSVAQHTQLVLTFLHGLCSHSLPQCDLASQLLLMVSEDHSIKQEQVGAWARRPQPLSLAMRSVPCAGTGGPGRAARGDGVHDGHVSRAARVRVPAHHPSSWKPPEPKEAVGPKDAPGSWQRPALPPAA